MEINRIKNSLIIEVLGDNWEEIFYQVFTDQGFSEKTLLKIITVPLSVDFEIKADFSSLLPDNYTLGMIKLYNQIDNNYIWCNYVAIADTLNIRKVDYR